jgi:hypothetical protein
MEHGFENEMAASGEEAQAVGGIRDLDIVARSRPALIPPKTFPCDRHRAPEVMILIESSDWLDIDCTVLSAAEGIRHGEEEDVVVFSTKNTRARLSEDIELQVVPEARR